MAQYHVRNRETLPCNVLNVITACNSAGTLKQVGTRSLSQTGTLMALQKAVILESSSAAAQPGST